MKCLFSIDVEKYFPAENVQTVYGRIGNQRVALAIRSRRVKSMKYLPELRQAIQHEIGIQKQEKIAA